ncbi:hypothetical protein MNBD_IGNAVI01-2876 [hydrothermal vent metagenome]|uniref:Uncharacterized protein n=1 Tax=hydrothermal vent metagenome TaxID=652676 RepID=A0A3B1C6L9_9ZZZZ
MKTRILIILTALAFSLGGCYTSFATREYEEETFGQVEESPTVDSMTDQPDSMIVFQDEDGNLDTVYLYTGNDTEVNDKPAEEVTIVNNYYDGGGDDGFMVGGFFGFPTFYAPVPFYSYYNPYFYDPFYWNYYPPYYSYYGPSIYVYGDYYAGYYNGGTYYPSEERYRSNQSHWTNLRNNDGGRRVSRKSRDSYRTLPVASRGGANEILNNRINLDREMRKISTSPRKTELASLNKGGIRKANLEVSERAINRKSDAKAVSSRYSKTRKVVKRESVKQSKPKRTSREAKYSRQNTNRKRTYIRIQNKSSYGKRKNKTYRKSYSNSRTREATSSSKRSGSSKSYKRQRTTRSSGKAYNSNSSRSSYKSNSSRRSRSSSSSYKGSRSPSRSSYSGSSSRSSSRSSYRGSSSRSSSRSSYSRPSSHSSSRSSSGRSSSSRSGGRRR